MNQRGGNETRGCSVSQHGMGRGAGRRHGDRREFLKTAGTVSLGLAVAQASAGTAALAGESGLPEIPFGKYRLSRLICGANPFNAGSHLSTFVNQEMRSYYTAEQIVKTLRRCEEVGINCWQISGERNLEHYRRLLDEGSRMHIISLGRDPAKLPVLAKAGCIGLSSSA